MVRRAEAFDACPLPGRRAFLAAIAALGAAACDATPPARTAHAPPQPAGRVMSSDLKTVDGLIDWIAANRAHVGFAAFTPGEPERGIYWQADERFPLASTKKVLMLCAFARAVAAGTLRADEPVSLEALERWYWPHTDGGAHVHALTEWKAKGIVDHLTLGDVAWAMIRWSDNAATDFVLARVGGTAATSALAARLGMTHQDPVAPILGEFVAWSTISEAEWIGMSPAARAARATELAAATPRTALGGLPMPDGVSQRRLAATNGAGSPREWAGLMAKLLTGDAELGEPVLAVTRPIIEWPLAAFPANRIRFERFGGKGGSLSGVMTGANYFKPQAGAPLAVALFFRDLPEDAEQALRASFVQQKLVSQLALDPALGARLRAAFGSPTAA